MNAITPEISNLFTAQDYLNAMVSTYGLGEVLQCLSYTVLDLESKSKVPLQKDVLHYIAQTIYNMQPLVKL